MNLSLEGVRAVVMGGADSTGLAVSRALLTQGARVHVGDVSGEALRQALRDEPRLTGSVVDVSRPEAVHDAFVAARAALGTINALINVVGVPGPESPVEEIADDAWARTLAANVNGHFYAIREAVPDMKRAGGGAIVNFSSGSTRTNMPNRLPYVVSKWAVEGMTRALARELGPHGIRVNALLPGLIDNARMQGIIERNAMRRGTTPAELRQEYLRYISMHSAISPEEIAATVVFLCSDDARHLTGQLIGVDGNIEWEA